ncbi:MAG: glycoside hydrolase family 5 protein [Capsulimonadaceae bacterium]
MSRSSLQNASGPLGRLAGAAALSAALTCLAAPVSALGMLHTAGVNIVDSSGDVVRLHGLNLGGWLVMEGWMTPMDSSGHNPDEYSLVRKLDTRFGVETEQRLIEEFQKSWITTTDLDNIRNAGFNCVRVPVWWGNFYTLSSYGARSGWRSDAFKRLDWLVSNCSTRGIYVIIDMHGAVGGQSTSQDCGEQHENAYWTHGSYQSDTAWMWRQIARHYNGNPTVAGYDLLNEPTGAPSVSAVWTAYNVLYNTVRRADQNHMIFIEGAFGDWNWSMLPAPSTYLWTNVVYEMHEYQVNGNAAQVEAGAQNQVNDFINHRSWNVPAYIGEFNDMGNGPACSGYTNDLYDNSNISWTMWSYKATHGLNPDSWGFYDPTRWPATPNIEKNSAATIAADWSQWTTPAAFALNTTVPAPNAADATAMHTPDQSTGFDACLAGSTR